MFTSHGRRGLSYSIAGCAALAILLTVIMAAPFPSQKAALAASSFVTRCGIHFCLNGNRFYYAGANSYDIFTFGDGSNTSTANDIETKFMDKASIDAVFANAQSDHIQVMRTWMFDHESWHGFETAKGVWGFLHNPPKRCTQLYLVTGRHCIMTHQHSYRYGFSGFRRNCL